MSGELRFRGGVSASFYCSFRTGNEQWASVSGTAGLVHVPDFVLPFFGDETRFDVTQSVLEVDGCRFDLQRRRRRVSVAEYGNGHPTAQEACMFREFSRLVTTNGRDRHWGDVALKTQVLLARVPRVRDSGARGRTGLGAVPRRGLLRPPDANALALAPRHFQRSDYRAGTGSPRLTKYGFS